MTGNIEPRTPREIHRSYGPSSDAALNPVYCRYVFFVVATRRWPSGVIGGRWPSGGSTISDDWRDGSPRSSQNGGGDVAHGDDILLDVVDAERFVVELALVFGVLLPLLEFVFGQIEPVAILRRPLERHSDHGSARPDSLQIRIAPGCLRRRVSLRRQHRSRGCGQQ